MASFSVQVMTPEGAAYEGDVEMVSTRTVVGSIGIKAGHEPLMVMVGPSELRIYESDDEVRRFAQGDGFLQMTGEELLLLVEEAIPVEQLDVADLRTKLSEAEERLAASAEDSADRERAQRDVARWGRFVEIAEAG